MLFDTPPPPAPEPVEYLMTPAHIEALHGCINAIGERLHGFLDDFHDGGWWVRIYENDQDGWISFIPYDPATGMRGGDMTCEFDRETGEITGEVMFGR
ncbi:hypothetical protein [Hyphobacterium marinum]|uniref:PepSY domain-containing protein n=1 Tax=Hyphobacterium marinum TaxID=3116574 RepID=A0ABU7LYE2_9PROT|nr:hypothetical protein [Hyphobacterium sp. Y6023]MEE2566559.1 hypothetical protein [Hyphobacterium sp. Y6023]